MNGASRIAIMVPVVASLLWVGCTSNAVRQDSRPPDGRLDIRSTPERPSDSYRDRAPTDSRLPSRDLDQRVSHNDGYSFVCVHHDAYESIDCITNVACTIPQNCPADAPVKCAGYWVCADAKCVYRCGRMADIK